MLIILKNVFNAFYSKLNLMYINYNNLKPIRVMEKVMIIFPLTFAFDTTIILNKRVITAFISNCIFLRGLKFKSRLKINFNFISKQF